MDAARRVLPILLLALCLEGTGPVRAAAAEQHAAPAPAGTSPAVASASRPAAPADVESRAIHRSGTLRGSGRGGPGETTRASIGWGMWLQTLGILAVVLAAMGLVLKFLRRSGLGRSFGGSTAAVQILSRGYLTNKHQMVLVRFGQRVLLLGLGPQNLAVLSEVREPSEAAHILAQLQAGKAGSAVQDFQQTIEQAVQQYDRQGNLDPAVIEPSVAPAGEGPQVGALRQELRSLLARMASIGRK